MMNWPKSRSSYTIQLSTFKGCNYEESSSLVYVTTTTDTTKEKPKINAVDYKWMLQLVNFYKETN